MNENICSSVIVRVENKWICFVVAAAAAAVVATLVHRVEERVKENWIFPFVSLRDLLNHFNDTQLEGNMCTAIMNFY